jgi:hypothetical protein
MFNQSEGRAIDDTLNKLHGLDSNDQPALHEQHMPKGRILSHPHVYHVHSLAFRASRRSSLSLVVVFCSPTDATWGGEGSRCHDRFLLRPQ